MSMLKLITSGVLLLLGAASVQAQARASQTPTPVAPAGRATAVPRSADAGVSAASDYTIGPDDVLSIVFWRDKDMSADVAVRPDGKISLPLLNDVQAAGLTPAQLRDRVADESKRYLEDPNVSVVVKQINSRKVFVTGEVMKPGSYLLIGPTTLLQMLATAGGLKEYADAKRIVLVRFEAGRTVAYPFNYKDVASRKNLKQNIELKPGDTIVVP